VCSVTEDSRRVTAGSIFVALDGGKVSGYAFVAEAVAAGAVAVLGAQPSPPVPIPAPYLCHPHPRRALGLIAHALKGDPTTRLSVTGVTGTNGKSSTVALSTAILRTAGLRADQFGTLGYTV